MNLPAADSWPEWNRQQLLAALAEVRAALARALGESSAPETPPAESPARGEFKSALDVLCEAFGLSPFERAVLLLGAGPELDCQFAPILARLNREPGRAAPTFALALAALPRAHWSALSPAAPLRRWRLIELGSGDSLANSPLRIDERVLHFLCGVDATEERLRGLLQPCFARGSLAPSQVKVVEQIRELWLRPPPRPIIQLLGLAEADPRAVAAAVGASLGLRLRILRAADLPAAAAEREAVATLWERESVLDGALLLLDTHEAEPPELARARGFLDSLGGLALVAGGEPLPGLRSRTVRLDVSPPPPAEQCALWRDALGPERAGAFNGEIEAVAQQFRLDAGSIRELAGVPLSAATDARALWEACRLRTRSPLEVLAQRLDARAAWDDLVLPPEPMRALRELAAHVRQRFRVYEDWGFAAKQSRGLGISVLFTGPSGTGKTLAAGWIATHLGLPLYRVDLANVTSKYIGETEKNLARLLARAEQAEVILLFDEADSLFGKRTDIRDSNDRFANAQTNYLLQRIESYDGLVLLTSNSKARFDSAFTRRLDVVLEFPLPNPDERRALWLAHLGPRHSLAPAELNRLAALADLAGGHIRNAVLTAALLARHDGRPIALTDCVRGLEEEFRKVGRPPPNELAAGRPPPSCRPL